MLSNCKTFVYSILKVTINKVIPSTINFAYCTRYVDDGICITSGYYSST